MDGYPRECDICFKEFTGPSPAQQHFMSTEHKRKAEHRANLKPGLSCYVCVISCDSLKILQEHEQSPRHLANVEKQRAYASRHEMKRPVVDDMKLSNTDNEYDVNMSYNKGMCDLCNVAFTSLKQATDHLQGKAHQKKLANWKTMKQCNTSHLREKVDHHCGNKDNTDGRETAVKIAFEEEHKTAHQNNDLFAVKECNACKEVFTSKECAEQHFRSQKHRQTLKNSEIKARGPAIELMAQMTRTFQTNLTLFDNKSRPQFPQNAVHAENDGFCAKPFPIEVELDRRSHQENHVPDNKDAQRPLLDNSAGDYGFQPLRLDGDSIIRSNTSLSYVHNQLEPIPRSMSIGCGRGVFSLLDQMGDSVQPKVNNTSVSNGDPSLEFSRVSIAEKSDTSTEKEINIGYKTVNSEQAHKWSQFTEDFSDKYQQKVNNSSAKSSVLQQPAGNTHDEEYIFYPSTGRGKCFVCDIEFTSMAHMKQHLTGQKHRKAKAVQEHLAQIDGLDISPLVCRICSVTFTGIEAQEQHMNSEKHLAKEKALFFGKTEHFCDVCKITCSGPDNYKQHLAGAQHLKMTGATASHVTDTVLNLDRTQWHHCEICKCNLNSSEQLMIHKESPKHIKQLEKMTSTERFGFHDIPIDDTGRFECKVCDCYLNTLEQLRIHEASPKHIKQQQKKMGDIDAKTIDRTTWFHCNVCNCDLNTADQLRIHETSPAHCAKAMKNKSIVPDTSAVSNPVKTSPLDAFLSEPLFPDYLVPTAEQALSQRINTHEDLNFDDLFRNDQGMNNSGENEGHASNNSGQGGKVKLYSDIAWATRSRGDRESRTGNDKKSSSEGSPQDVNAPLGARPRRGLSPTVDNPHAATHPYYCHTCKAPMNTKESYEIHLKGRRHMQKVCVESAPIRQHRPPEGGQYPPCTKTTPRSYQHELFRKAMSGDALCFLPTGTGKTLVAVMVISAMLSKCPTKNVLFLVDKVLLVLQQAKQIKKELGEQKFMRYDTDGETYIDPQRREVRVAAVCMGLQNTNGIPLWQHDVVVVTADFCRNLLDKEILRWTDFSLVVFDEAHHCDKSHPFNTLLTSYHQQVKDIEDRPKILGLTASPAGKSDVPKTYQMLLKLVENMGNVQMSVVEEPDNVDVLKQYQSNAEMIIRSPICMSESPVKKLLHEFNVYITYCVMKLQTVSNIDNYMNCKNELYKDMSDEAVRKVADGFVSKNIDLIQSSLLSLQNDPARIEKVQFALLLKHVESVCMAWSSLVEGGELCVRQELEDLQMTDCDFAFASKLGLPASNIVQLLGLDKSGFDDMFESVKDIDSSVDMNIKRVLDELTSPNRTTGHSISLVLVKQRGTAHLISRLLQNSSKMQSLGLHTTHVVGHGGSGTSDKGMSVNQQRKIMEEIKDYKYQVVVATSVAEEGVDWPECDRVISMYPPTTVTALVQMRGRARKKGSKFIILCVSQEEEAKLQDIMQREKNMIEATRMLIQGKRNS